MTYWLVSITRIEAPGAEPVTSTYSMATYAAARRKESRSWRDRTVVRSNLALIEGVFRAVRRRDRGRPSTLPGYALSGRHYNA